MPKLTESRSRKWLRGELPRLVEAGVLTPDSAAAVERHYAGSEPETGFGFILLAVIGTALVGAGVILLVARNWEELSRPIRCALAFLPLLASLVFGFFVLQRRNHSAAWRESSALFNIAATATALSLVSQTYQIQGSFADFVAVCLILALPVVYLFSARFSAAVYMLGCVAWIVSKSGWALNAPDQTTFWLFIALILPFYIHLCLIGRRGWTFGMLTTALVASCFFGVTATEYFARMQFGPVSIAGFFTLIYLCGIVRVREFENPLNALTVLGAIGVAVTAIVLSFENEWPTRNLTTWADLSVEQKLGVAICLFFPVASIAVAVWVGLRHLFDYSVAAACLPVMALIGRWLTGPSGHPSWVGLLFNIYTLILGSELLVRGIRAGSVTRANFGLLIIVALACTRFFDSQLTFVARGVGFICVGVAFLVANMIFFRRRPSA